MKDTTRRRFLQVAPAGGALALAQTGPQSAVPSLGPDVLWYTKPTEKWEEALAIGNGRLGAMVFGGVEKERLQLNEVTVWSGKLEKAADRSGAHTHLPENPRDDRQ